MNPAYTRDNELTLMNLPSTCFDYGWWICFRHIFIDESSIYSFWCIYLNESAVYLLWLWLIIYVMPVLIGESILYLFWRIHLNESAFCLVDEYASCLFYLMSPSYICFDGSTLMNLPSTWLMNMLHVCLNWWVQRLSVLMDSL